MRRALTATLAAAALLLTGCGEAGFSGLYNTPLPGGADLGEHPYRVTAQFADVLDLVPQASVKVNDVAVGRVEKVELAEDTTSAIVTMAVNGDIELPANSAALLRQSSLLGEKFVELRAPSDEQAAGRLTDGARIPLSRTNRNPEVEEVLGALSLLLNGGGIEQLSNITRELNAALSGNEAEVRTLLARVDEIATELDGQKGEIVRAIDGLNRLSSTLVAQQGNLNTALDHLEPGLRVVTAQRDQLVGMLQSLDALSGVAVDTINRSRDELVANLRALEPTLRKLAEAGTTLPIALQILPTYPFPDSAGAVIRGDYANVHARVDLNLDQLLQNFTNSSQPILPVPPNPVTGAVPGGTDGGTGDGAVPVLPLPGTPAPARQGGVLGSLLGGLLGGDG